jgi:hypothetical protein
MAGALTRDKPAIRTTLESQDGSFAVIGIAGMVAVREPRPDFPQIARRDWAAAQHTRGLRLGRPPVHYDEPHVAPPNAKQYTASDG